MCSCPQCVARGPNYSDAWMAETEARHVANLPSNEARTRFLNNVQDRRGFPAMRELKRAAWALMKQATNEVDPQAQKHVLDQPGLFA